MEADYDFFKIIPKYLKALPRATKYEIQALDQKLIQRGQQEPIKIRRSDNGILNGYTRHDLLGQRGKKIKYEYKDFDNEEDEFAYVVESNVMQRHLNIFQRVEAMYEFYVNTVLEKRMKNRTVHFDIFRALKEGAYTTKDIVKYTKYETKSVGRILTELTKSYFISRQLDSDKKGVGTGNKMYKYKLMPKGEEVLSKSQPRRLGASMDLLSEVVGASPPSVRYAVDVIKHGNEKIIQDCRDGIISLNQAHHMISGNTKKVTHHETWKKWSKIKCPSCEKIHLKKEYELVQ